MQNKYIVKAFLLSAEADSGLGATPNSDLEVWRMKTFWKSGYFISKTKENRPPLTVCELLGCPAGEITIRSASHSKWASQVLCREIILMLVELCSLFIYLFFFNDTAYNSLSYLFQGPSLLAYIFSAIVPSDPKSSSPLF